MGFELLLILIHLGLYRDKTFIGANVDNFKYGIFVNAGAFISDKAIITCGHCICNDKHVLEIGGKHVPFEITCGPENPLGGSEQGSEILNRSKCAHI